MTPPTVNAYFNPQMNDINFPAGVLQPPLYDVKLDDAPNYGNTGATIGHELTHAFDDEGRQFDAKGNLRDWWTEADAKGFEDRINCVRDQYASYVVVDDIHENSKLTSGEDVADLGGTLIAYLAWKQQVAGQQQTVDGFTPDQRFFHRHGAVGVRESAAGSSCGFPLPRTRIHRGSRGSTGWFRICRSSSRPSAARPVSRWCMRRLARSGSGALASVHPTHGDDVSVAMGGAPDQLWIYSLRKTRLTQKLPR